MNANNDILLKDKICPPIPEAVTYSHRTRVWLVDDNRNIRKLLAGLLEAEGFDCSRQFPSAEAVLAALSVEAAPDVILLDHQMKGMTGAEALTPIKTIAVETRVLMLTSCCDPHTMARAFQNGASDFLSKTSGATEIAERIRRAQSTPVSKSAQRQLPFGQLQDGIAGCTNRGKMLSERIREFRPERAGECSVRPQRPAWWKSAANRVRALLLARFSDLQR
jgi:DNA-binding NtrC family response regulator